MSREHGEWVLVSSGLVREPKDRRGIYWLRSFRRRGEVVAVFTEVPGNVGRSLTNAIESLTGDLLDPGSFDLEKLRVFQILPSGYLDQPIASVDEVQRSSDGVRWRSTTRGALEKLLGAPLPPLPGHEELLKSVFAVTRQTHVEVVDPTLERVDISELPPPHNPSRCTHYGRFLELVKNPVARADGAVGQAFRSSLTPKDVGSCRRHAVDWRAIGLDAIRIFGENRSRAKMASAAQRSVVLRGDALRLLVSLFASPITIRADSYIDGQHRACGLWFSGITEAVVSRSDNVTYEPLEVWTYRGDG